MIRRYLRIVARVSAALLVFALALPGCKKDAAPGPGKKSTAERGAFSCAAFLARNKRCRTAIAVAIGKGRPGIPETVRDMNAAGLSSERFGEACRKWTMSTKAKDVRVTAGWRRCFTRETACDRYAACLIATGKR